MPQTAHDSPWLAQGEDKREAVREMFADIAPSYDVLNSLMSFRLHKRWRSLGVKALNLKPGDDVLDVCCGTGDFLLPLRKAVGSEGTVTGLDFCQPMLDIAKTKVHGEAELHLGDACSLPFTDSKYDAVTVGWGLRNVPDIQAALKQAFRVLKPGGRFISLDMAKPKSGFVGGIAAFSFKKIVPALGSMFGKTKAYKYLPESTERFLSREQMDEALRTAGFTEVWHRDFFFGNICLHYGRKA